MQSFQNEFGYGYQTQKYFAFFGNKRLQTLNLNAVYPANSFCFLKQTHSDLVVQASSEKKSADAHWTDHPHFATVVQTADCMPILIYCSETHRVCAVHAGWRGVHNQITAKALDILIQTGSTTRKFQVLIGPSIQKESFEVQQDVFDLLKSSQHVNFDRSVYFQSRDRYFVDLQELVARQIKNCTNGQAQVIKSEIDTKTDLRYCSYRREPAQTERNLSFICLST